MVETLPSCAGGASSISGQGTKVPVSKVKLKINKHNIVNQLHVNFKNQKKIETVNVTKEDKSTFFISGGSFSAFSALTLQLQPLKVKAS